MDCKICWLSGFCRAAFALSNPILGIFGHLEMTDIWAQMFFFTNFLKIKNKGSRTVFKLIRKIIVVSLESFSIFRVYSCQSFVPARIGCRCRSDVSLSGWVCLSVRHHEIGCIFSQTNCSGLIGRLGFPSLCT
jgi:hypothetical protein